MSAPIESYALIGDTRTAALVGSDGAVEWLCLPRFDSPACFAALLGSKQHGRWQLAPATTVRRVRRRYRPDTLILESEFETDEGTVRLIDCMPPEGSRSRVLRMVEGVRGRVAMHMELAMRFGYGEQIPWVRRIAETLVATAGPHSLELRSPIETIGKDFTTTAEFRVSQGEHIPFLLTYFPSHEAPPPAVDGRAAIDATERWWQAWCARCRYGGRWRDAIMQSLVVLKALTYGPTGGIVAAPTTSLPEQPGGIRNWDYRFCWLRDATLTLYALLLAGYTTEAQAWREWLLRAAAGRPEDLQTLYGVMGERDLLERELAWLPGYEHSSPVRIGNAAADQLQLDVYGEIMDALYVGRAAGLESESPAWALQRVLVEFVESHWEQPDNGIWEFRGDRQHFTHSKVMAWVALDRAIKSVEHHGLHGPVERWRKVRARIHHQVCERGFDATRGTFVQAYGSKNLDASLLMIPLVGFLPATDPRVRGTIRAVESELMVGGLVTRYTTSRARDGLPPGEGTFLPCSFWLVDNLALTGQREKAERMFEHLLSLRNDLGLLSEEYDPANRRMLGNFPQALTHLSIVNSARNLIDSGGPAEHRSGVAGHRLSPPSAS